MGTRRSLRVLAAAALLAATGASEGRAAAGGCADETARFDSADAAALAVEVELDRRGASARRYEWAFAVFRDSMGYCLTGFRTDGDRSEVTIVIPNGAVAAGHSHTSRQGVFRAHYRGENLSKHDLGENGVLRAQEKAGRCLPHYLVTPKGRVRVWEWSVDDRVWKVRDVSPVIASGS